MIEQVVLSHLVYNEAFARKTIPFLKREYFEDPSQQVIFDLIDAYINKYNAFPTSEALQIDLGNKDNISEELHKKATNVIAELRREEDTNLEWLVDQAEQFCKEHSLHNALRESINIMGDKSGQTSTGMIPKLLTDALSVSFDSDIGHDFLEDAEKRFEYYHRKEERISFDIELLNKISNGGVPKKTLNVILGGVNVGKTLIMCHFASDYLMQGKNVLYITMEMSEEEISKRIDANLMDIAMNDLMVMNREAYMRKVSFLKNKTQGRLKIKEYPTAGAGAANFRHLLNEYRIKSNFVPDAIFIDYINICTSTRLKGNSNHNSYTIIKAIAEELRGLAVEFNLPVWTATQLTRSGFSSGDVDLGDVAECIWVDEQVKLYNSDDFIKLSDVKVGDQIISNDGYKTVVTVHHEKRKDCVRVTTASGKSIIVSKDHIFPTNSGRKSYNSGLVVGDSLSTSSPIAGKPK